MKTTIQSVGLLSVIVVLLASAAVIASPLPPFTPSMVPGKEYSNHLDEDAAGAIDPHQNIWWDGLGGAADTFDYTGELVARNPEYEFTTWVDALANTHDAFYYEVSHFDSVEMLTSFTTVPDIHLTNDVSHGIAHGGTSVWATAPIINAASPPDDVDGLEVWGGAGPGADDADKYSLIGDPVDPITGFRVSVWNYLDPVPGGVATPYIFAASLAVAIGRPDLEEVIDLDAMIVFDNADPYTFTFDGDPAVGAPPDSIMFSIAPIIGAFDGGEIWVWDLGGPAAFLIHGGEVWDTAHGVAAHFGLVPSSEHENINALEAVPGIPEPATICLIALGGLAMLRRRIS